MQIEEATQGQWWEQGTSEQQQQQDWRGRGACCFPGALTTRRVVVLGLRCPSFLEAEWEGTEESRVPLPGEGGLQSC